ncbi:DUF4214 domain-containing protein [Cellulomonas sp. KRMCY2]|uniref:DUF4214 domain-containing protein n=1 Tax=Cellulomonas sp. KRMCY2 TaxID=1304865 RepID=UPI00045E6721|nr:DUF4214 domain-containing protein [Cellulomonas sp. KRMCY2]
MANSITYSTEYRARLIGASYARYLNRGPDAVGLSTWLAAMKNGWTISQMESGFIASPEYYAKAGSTDAGWVAALYTDVLGRAAGANEITYWTGRLADGAGRVPVAMGFLLSTERLRTVVDEHYQHLLGRGIDPSGQSTWVGILQAGGRDEAIIGGIIASDEYWSRGAATPAVLTASALVRAGSPLAVSGSGFKPGSTVRVSLQTGPLDLGTVAVSAGGAFSATLLVPAGVPDGVHTVVAEGRDGSGLPTRAVASVRVDSTGPSVTTVTVSKPVAAPGDVVTFQGSFADVAGVASASLRVGPGAGFCDPTARLTEGSATLGTWSVTCTVPLDATAGQYTVTPSAADVVGNWLNTNGGPTTTVRATFTVAPVVIVPPDIPAVQVTAGSVVRPGGSLAVSGSGFKPGSTTRLVLHSDPIDLGTVTVSGAGTFSTTVTVPSSTPEGAHEIEAAGQDMAGSAAGATAPLVIDASPPVVDWITVSPTTASPGQVLTFSGHFTDAVGLASAALQVGMNGDYFCDTTTALTSGTVRDGVWSLSCTVPALALSGPHEVLGFAYDIAGNWGHGTPMVGDPVRGTFTVIGGREPSVPVVSSVTVSPAVVAPGEPYVISADITSDVGMTTVQLVSALDGAEGVEALCTTETATLTAGTATDGTWSLSCTAPAQVLSGSYTVTAYGWDAGGIWFNGSIGETPRGTFTIAGGYADVQRPTVVSVDVTPSPVPAGQTLTISTHLTSPVGVAFVQIESTADGVEGNSSFCNGVATLTSGTATDGYWTMSCTVPGTVAAPFYTVKPYFRDVLGQWVNVNGPYTSDVRGHFEIA